MPIENNSGDRGPEQPSNKIRILGEDGQIYFVDSKNLKPTSEPTAQAPLQPEVRQPEPLTSPPLTPTETPMPEKSAQEYKEEIDPEELRELSTQIIAFNVNNYDELNALGGIPLDELQKMTPEERQQKEIEMQDNFNARARRFFENVVVHHTGEYYYGINAATNSPIVFNTTDIDGRGAVGLLRLADVYTGTLQYVKPSNFREGKVNLDTGDRWGLVVGLPGEGEKGLSPDEIAKRDLRKTVIIDHHGPNAPKNMCATKFTYQVLAKLGMVGPDEVLDKTVDLVNEHDNGRFPFELYEKSDKIIAGLINNMRFEGTRMTDDTVFPGLTNMVYHLIEKQGVTDIRELASAELDDAAIEVLGLQRAQRDKREEINNSVEALKEAQKNGFVVNSPKYGRIVVDVAGRVKGGWQAIKCPTILGQANDIYIKWPGDRFKEKGFFISASKDFDNDIQALIDREGLKVRGNMWLKNQAEEPLQTSLADILFAMGVPEQEILKSRNTPEGKFNPRGLFAQIQREQDRTGRRPYAQIQQQRR